jgi:riboflavin biosynthesis pyrimidine reductase
MKVKVSKLVDMLQKRVTEEKAAHEKAIASRETSRRKELEDNAKAAEGLAAQIRKALKEGGEGLYKQFVADGTNQRFHVYGSDDYRKHGETAAVRALRILSLTAEEDITLAEATKLVGEALKL